MHIQIGLRSFIHCQAKYFSTDLINSNLNALKQQLQLTLVFDRLDFYRSKLPSIEATLDRIDLHSHDS